MFFFVDVRDFHLTRSISWVFKSFLHFSFKSTQSLNHCNTSCQSNCYMLKLQFFGCFRRCLLHALQLMPFIHPSNQRNFVRCCPAYAHFTLSPFFSDIRSFVTLSVVSWVFSFSPSSSLSVIFFVRSNLPNRKTSILWRRLFPRPTAHSCCCYYNIYIFFGALFFFYFFVLSYCAYFIALLMGPYRK